MHWTINCICLAFLCLYGFTNGEIDKPPQFLPRNDKVKDVLPSNFKSSSTGNIKFDDDPLLDHSGDEILDETDDEDLAGSGSGSGSGDGVIPAETEVKMTTSTPMMTPSTASSRPLTHCELNYQSGKAVSGLFVPRCLPNGDYDSLQCHGYPGTSQCYCSDLDGRQIPGTLMEPPKFPNCETGQNLNSCIFLSVKHIRSKMVGSFRPKCTIDGNFEKVQCHGSMCYCVDEASGTKVAGTEVHLPDSPNCDDDEEVTPVSTPKSSQGETSMEEDKKVINIDEPTDNTPKTVTEENGTMVIDEDINVNIDKTDGNTGSSEEVDEDNKSGTDRNSQASVEKASSEIMTQPGILAGIIGGSVVVLLCVVLLIMFLIYRMRKKDEGSYPLDEPRKPPNYSYVRAPEKEFYA
ncbi:unnamed protein product [Lymnaea stagnalis]|uniref:Syndecan n=2 Tax=Lymnaea stagnalis TaxID=6523 RepID=A0AAV2I9T9_LYMST